MEIKFEPLGIADVLTRYHLKVPLNQREYSWETDHVEDLLRDITNNLRNPAYFLGTIMLTSKGNALEVADGQQRLATTTMILVAMRDIYLESNDGKRADGTETKYLYETDIDTGEIRQKLTLNADDNTFFATKILARPTERKAQIDHRRDSHKLIANAFNIIRKNFASLREQYGEKGFNNLLADWRKFLTERAMVIVCRAPSALNAFLMFHTLNDRGLKTSQADLVKNHLFEQAGEDRIPEAQTAWSLMRGTIEATGEDDLIMDYLRHVCCVLYSHTTERKIFDRIEANAQGATDSMLLLTQLSDMAKDYCAIMNPDHPKWIGYDPQIRGSIRALNLLKVSQIRPLLLAATRQFTNARTIVAFDRFVSWSVRFIVSGGGRGGTVEELYSTLAHKIHKREVKTIEDMDKMAREIVPTDAEFQASFETFRVNVPKLARYLLRSLELEAEGSSHPGWVPVETADVNLEHIMPQTLSPNWPNVTEHIIETHANRLGNLALLEASVNVDIDKEKWAVKKAALSKSVYTFTRHVKDASSWGIKEIDERQKTMAKHAVKAWPIG